ncbi:MAG: hypothetical protein JWO03_219 [Bacteroidetes bacterium]|nr:hypothetical protein [Bacteroidota bacterium]
MITVQHKAKQFELHLKFSTGWLHSLATTIAGLLDFSDMRAIRKQKEQMLHEFGDDYLKMN